MDGEGILRKEKEAMRRVRLRIVAAFLMLGVLALIGASLVAFQLTTNTQRALEEAREAEDKVLHAAEIARHGTAIAAGLYQHAISPLPEEQIEDLRARMEIAQDHMTAIGPLIASAELVMYRRAMLLFGRFRDTAEEVIEAGQQGEQQRASALLQGELLPVLTEARTIAEDIIERNQRRANVLLRQINERMRTVMTATVVCTVLFILIVAAAGYYTLRNVREQQQRIIEQMSRLGQAVRDLDAFAGRIAHDIRGPLAPILLAAQQLLHSRDPEVVERATHRILRSAKRASHLTESLLDFSRAGQAPPGGRCPAGAAVERALEETRDAAEQANIDLDLEIPSHEVAIDEALLTQCIQNLLVNAIRYMPADATRRRVELRTNIQGECLRFQVADTGRGIPAQEQERVFRPFYRWTLADDETGGTGLGLATVRRIIEAHHGEVGISDNPGGGTIVWFTIPLHRGDEETLDCADAGGEAGGGHEAPSEHAGQS